MALPASQAFILPLHGYQHVHSTHAIDMLVAEQKDM